MPKVSIIVPVYKVEAYLHRCVESILAQTYTDWELLLVDDGSPDQSGIICDEYDRKDARIKVFHKENGGVSLARNLGLDNAEGEFITFIDADDFIDSDCLEKVIYLFKQNHFDVLQCSIVRVNKDKVFSVNSKDVPMMSGVDYLKTESGLLCAGGNFISNSIIGNNRFPVGIRYGEDRMFLLRTIEKAEKVMRTSCINYYYEHNPDSASQTPQTNAVIESINSTLKIIDEFPYLNDYFNSVIVGYVLSIIRNNDIDYDSDKKLLNDTTFCYSKRLPLIAKIYVIMNNISCQLTFTIFRFLFVIKKSL